MTKEGQQAIDDNLYTCGVFLDFSKAFDTINHKIFLKKLAAYGIRGLPLQWLTGYLTDRQPTHGILTDLFVEA